MTDLPSGWEWATLGEVAETSLGKMLDKKQATGLHPTRYLRNVNVRWGTFDLTDVAQMDVRPDELERVLARPGDVIACEGGEPGRAAVWRGPGMIALQKALHRIRPTKAISPAYLAFLLQHLALSRRLETLFTGTTIKHLPQEKLRLVRIPTPPRAEQDRIVAAIEERLSHLDAANRSLEAAERRITVLRSTLLDSAFRQPDHTVAVGDVAEVHLGRQRSPRNHLGPYMRPYLRAANVTWSGLDLTDVKEMNFEPADARTFELLPGDILLNEASGSPSEVGKPAVWTGEIEGCCFQNTLLRVRTKGPLIGYLYWYFFYAASAGRFGDAARGVNIRHLGKQGLARFPIPVPPQDQQETIVRKLNEGFEDVNALRRTMRTAQARQRQLRRAILAAAFVGTLVRQDPADEPAAVLLERIRRERAVTNGRKRRAGMS